MRDTSVNTLKSELRQKMLQKRREYDDVKRKEDSLSIFELLTQQPIFKKARTILSYMSLDDEVSTRILHESMRASQSLFIPTIQGDELVPAPLTDANKLAKGRYGISEPVGDFLAQESYTFDLILVPAVAVDREGSRLGMGKGYYDRFLKKCSGTAVAMVFDFQVVDKVPTDIYDVTVSFVLTPHHFFSCKQTSTFQHS